MAAMGLLPDNRLARPLREAFDAVGAGWRPLCERFVHSAEGRRLCDAVDARVAAGQAVFPATPLRALAEGGPADVRVVILGQDPYHGVGEAEGLAFSVPRGVRVPPSLRNIHRELQDDLGLPPPAHGSLQAWSRAGVLLLNSSLTVEQDAPASHARLGWQAFTDAVIAAVAADPAPKVFLLWGAHAQAKQALIGTAGAQHLILCSNHPSPLSARRPPLPFLGSRPFSRACAWLADQGRGAPSWSL
jgi:uracil-DNA glycosylase